MGAFKAPSDSTILCYEGAGRGSKEFLQKQLFKHHACPEMRLPQGETANTERVHLVFFLELNAIWLSSLKTGLVRSGGSCVTCLNSFVGVGLSLASILEFQLLGG